VSISRSVFDRAGAAWRFLHDAPFLLSGDEPHDRAAGRNAVSGTAGCASFGRTGRFRAAQPNRKMVANGVLGVLTQSSFVPAPERPAS
jgi:hypothetical protein